MNIAVIGAGPRATGICQLLTAGGYDVTRAGLEDGAAYDASTGSDADFAGARGEMDTTIAKVGRILPETIVVDAMEGSSPDGPTESGAELLAKQLNSPCVVRASIERPERTPTFCWPATTKTR